MNEIKFKSWELTLKELISIPYYVVLTLGSYVAFEENILMLILCLLAGWYFNAFVFWQLYKINVLNKTNKRHIFLYISLLTFVSIVVFISLALMKK